MEKFKPMSDGSMKAWEMAVNNLIDENEKLKEAVRYLANRLPLGATWDGRKAINEILK